MSINISHSSSNNASQSINNSSPAILRRSMSLPAYPFETKHACISQPSPPGNNQNTASITNEINNNGDDLDLGGGALEVSKLIRKDLIFMKEAVVEVNKYMEGLNVKINQACDKFRELQTIRGSEKELEELRKTVAKLKCRIPSNLNMHSNDSNPIQNPWSDTSIDNKYIQPDVNEVSEDTIAFDNLFSELDFTLQSCLYCFLNFPKNAIIKKRLIVYWWIGADITDNPDDPKREEEKANDYFDELVEKGFIEPVYEKRGLVADSCRIYPLVYSTLHYHAERFGWGAVHHLFRKQYFYVNVYPNFGSATLYDGLELLSNLKLEAKIVYLGRWQSSAASHHIEVTNIKIFDKLKNLKDLMFLSLRGISLITELPLFILELTRLKILDLRDCHNLEALPDRIDLLENLTHLDMSECYFLEHMPKALASLRKLEVLKGFFIGESKGGKISCTLGDLAKLPKLIKLNIYTGLKNFPTDEQLRDLQTFCVLKKLTISWGGYSILGEVESLERDCKNIDLDALNSKELPSTLRKLDLQCFPQTNAPNWLRPSKLKNLEKLYIRGGQLRDIHQFQSEELNDEEQYWTVEILRFKYLSELEMNWGDLRRLFPKLKCLEKEECPNLSGFSCDQNGVWMNRTEN